MEYKFEVTIEMEVRLDCKIFVIKVEKKVDFWIFVSCVIVIFYKKWSIFKLICIWQFLKIFCLGYFDQNGNSLNEYEFFVLNWMAKSQKNILKINEFDAWNVVLYEVELIDIDYRLSKFIN